jgi:hypothetical protein
LAYSIVYSTVLYFMVLNFKIMAKELQFFDDGSASSSSGPIGGAASYGSSSSAAPPPAAASSGGADNPFAASMPSGGMQQMSVESAGGNNSGGGGGGGSGGVGPGGVVNYFKRSSHPVASLFHVLFKLAAILTYDFGTLFTENYVLIFVCCVLLLAFDFWTVKNVTGRLMVGLRWESRMRDDGSSFWVYEALEDKSRISSIDSTIFWGAMWISPGLWAGSLVLGILKFNISWVLIVVVALSLNLVNLMGFIRCRKGAKKQAEQAMTSFMTTGMLTAITQAPGLVGSTLFGGEDTAAGGVAGGESGAELFV